MLADAHSEALAKHAAERFGVGMESIPSGGWRVCFFDAKAQGWKTVLCKNGGRTSFVFEPVPMGLIKVRSIGDDPFPLDYDKALDALEEWMPPKGNAK